MSNPPVETLAVDIARAAEIVGISRAQFYRLYINPGRVRPLKTGGRDRVVDVGELRAAYDALKTELRAADRVA